MNTHASVKQAASSDLSQADASVRELMMQMSDASRDVESALAISTPLAICGASLLAHAVTVHSQSFYLLGSLCIAAVVVVQVHARRRSKTMGDSA